MPVSEGGNRMYGTFPFLVPKDMGSPGLQLTSSHSLAHNFYASLFMLPGHRF
jgi:hypothetical protein